jgi:hypothetical protein
MQNRLLERRLEAGSLLGYLNSLSRAQTLLDGVQDTPDLHRILDGRITPFLPFTKLFEILPNRFHDTGQVFRHIDLVPVDVQIRVDSRESTMVLRGDHLDRPFLAFNLPPEDLPAWCSLDTYSPYCRIQYTGIEDAGESEMVRSRRTACFAGGLLGCVVDDSGGGVVCCACCADTGDVAEEVG